MSNVLLRSFDNIHEVSVLDTDTMGCSDKGCLEKISNMRFQGVRNKFGGSTIILYRDEELMLFIDGESWPFTLFQINYNRRKGKLMLSLEFADKVWELTEKKSISFLDVITDFFDLTQTDPEDFDFGLFLENIYNSSERQSLIFQTPQK